MNRIIFRASFTRDYLDDEGGLAFGDIGLDILDDSPLINYSFHETFHDEVMPYQIRYVDGLFLHDPKVTRQTFTDGAEDLIAVTRCGVGYDHIDLEACTDNDVVVTNAPQSMSLPTASAALMYLLVLSKKIMNLDALVRNGLWEKRSNIQGVDLRGKKLGIIGFGSIGRELARLVAPFSMKLIVYDPYLDKSTIRDHDVELVQLEALLRQADFVCIHCLLTKETTRLIGNRELSWMKPNAYLINMARGPVIDHDALVQALRNNKIAGAGLDVFYQEPLPESDPIVRMDNVVLSPHWAANTLDAFYNASTTNISDMTKIAKGEKPAHVLNKEVLEKPGFKRKLERFR